MKLLIHKERREVIEGRERTVSKPKQYFVKDLSKDFSTLYGIISLPSNNQDPDKKV